MSKANEPAFPLESLITPHEIGPDKFDVRGPIGLTKREYFAAMAMHGLLANPRAWEGSELQWAETGPTKCAADSLKFADALLAALSPEPTKGAEK